MPRGRERAPERPFGGLPEWRKANKGVKSLPRTPFYSGLRKEDRDYVFHVGGLSELQFNLGFEDVRGIPFNLEGLSLDVQILYRRQCLVRWKEQRAPKREKKAPSVFQILAPNTAQSALVQ